MLRFPGDGSGSPGEARGSGQRKTLDEHSARFDQLDETLDGIAVSVKKIANTQDALTNAVTAAIKQLGTGKTLELRVKRLEDAVFGAKH